MKKTTKGIIIAVLVIGSAALIICSPLLYYINSYRWVHNADFENYQSDFEIVKDYVIAHNPSESKTWFSTSYDQNREIRLYASNINDYLDLPDEVSKVLSRLQRDAFPHKDSKLDVIRLEKDRVSFCNVNGQYALVWSPNGKPKGVNTSDDERKCYVKKIKNSWYHVVADP